MGIRRDAGLTGNQLLMRVDNSAGKGTSGLDKFISSNVHRVHMELGGKLLNSLKIKTQFLERLQSVRVVDGATHTQKDDVERTEVCGLENHRPPESASSQRGPSSHPLWRRPAAGWG
jgi:hypothetical protein